MDEHKKFLADKLLSEEQPITYRLLSRALDVHVNTAKEMLYDFHKYQNGLHANSIHATYLISGTKPPTTGSSQDEDVEMTSSMPEAESEEVVTTTITLTREEDLNNALADYQKVTSIHVYSLSPHPQKDLSLLSDLSTQVLEYKTKEDSIVMAKKYGIIVNPQVRRRDRKGRAPAPAPAPTVTKPTVKQEPSKPAAVKNAKPEPAAKASFFAPKLKQETSDASSKDSTPASSAPGQKKSAPPLKRGDSGSIMQSFAKAKPPKPKPEPKKEEDTAMALSDDGEAGDDDMPISKKPAVDTDSIRKAKKEREEALRKMMEEDDDEEEEVPSEKDDEEMEEAPEPEPEPQSEEKKEEPAEVVSSTGNGRRRGKRRVMQKKRILDDQGYMVTIQEPGWESFSEDEAPPPSKKPAPTPSASSSAPKAKKPAGKGQGNIMSFFSKK